MLFIVFLAAPVIVYGQDDINAHRSCSHCGMDRKAYGYSRVLITYQDGKETGFCSLQCAARSIAAEPTHEVKSIQVADRDGRKLLDASKAYWVMGGSKRGVMTQNPKWAFGSKTGAEDFIKKYGGKLVSWEEVLAAANGELGREH